MTREIKFRIRNVNNGQWAYFKLTDNFSFLDNYNKDTICQYTGLKDKHGKEIYCGDRIKFRVGGAAASSEEGIVEYFDYYFGAGKGYGLGNLQDIEVIGNVYEGLQSSSKGDII